MADRLRRQTAVRAIINSFDGSTQEDIKTRLEDQGIVASQSTLSRDLREIGAVKVPVNGGRTVYKLPGSGIKSSRLGDIGRAMEEFDIGYEQIGNFLVIRTRPGNARDFCLVFDRQNWKEVVGTIAGDDTILVIARTPADIKSLAERLKYPSGKE